MNLRPAVLADCLTLAAIDAQGNPSPWTAQQFESAVQHHPDSVWLSQADHQITGFIVWQTVFDESELHLIAVAPEYRRQGTCVRPAATLAKRSATTRRNPIATRSPLKQ